MFANQPIIADHLTHNRSIFLFHKTLIVFQVWAAPRERDVCLLTISDHFLIDEFSPIIGIDAQDRKRQQQVCLLERSQNRHRTDQDSLQEASAGPSGPFEETEERRC